MKILFLDIDGVLNTFDNMYATSTLCQFDKTKYKSRDNSMNAAFDERAVRWLTYIIEKTNAKIVLSSTWRRMGLEKFKQIWSERNLIGDIVDVTPKFPKQEVEEAYQKYRMHEHGTRGFEIQE